MSQGLSDSHADRHSDPSPAVPRAEARGKFNNRPDKQADGQIGNPSSNRSDDQWKAKLTPEQYGILREKGTEAPFTGQLLHNDGSGDYTCAACGAVVFTSDTKFDSGSGWPSFYDPANTEAVRLIADPSLGVDRVEVTCATCGGHLGHVFHDAPDQPTGMRFCINSAALDFQDKK